VKNRLTAKVSIFVLILSAFNFVNTEQSVAAIITATGTNPSVCDQVVGSSLGVSAQRITNGDCVVKFTDTSAANTWTVPANITSATFLIIGGGGAGGARSGAGGGAGGYISGTQSLTPGNNLGVTVGAGAIGLDRYTHANNGSSTIVTGLSGGTITALGGGGGGGASNSGISRSGNNGGSGGGSGQLESGFANNTVGLATVAGRGNNGGGAPAAGANWPAGGGGGAGSAGAIAVNDSKGGNGGAGTANAITGTNTCYATGGGGGLNVGFTGGDAGTCPTFASNVNGGAGTSGSLIPAAPVANTGAGGGGSGWNGAADTLGGSGASGVVIISYAPYLTPPTFSVFQLSGGATVAAYRTAIVITATVNVVSKITFRMNGKVLPGCKNRTAAVSGSDFTATCSWRPSNRGSVTLTALATPTGAGITSATSAPISIRVGNRTTAR
jgi:hypothetical protein